MTPAELTDQVLQAYGDTPSPRLRELISALIAHLHAFAVQTRLTPQEWLAGMQFLTATGHRRAAATGFMTPRTPASRRLTCAGSS
jgi:hypothetical protein